MDNRSEVEYFLDNLLFTNKKLNGKIHSLINDEWTNTFTGSIPIVILTIMFITFWNDESKETSNNGSTVPRLKLKVLRREQAATELRMSQSVISRLQGRNGDHKCSGKAMKWMSLEVHWYFSWSKMLWILTFISLLEKFRKKSWKFKHLEKCI